MVFTILVWVVEAFVLLLVARALLSWFPITPGTPMASFMNVLVRITEPVLSPVRRILPPVRAGGAAIDLSVLIVILVAQIVVIPILER